MISDMLKEAVETKNWDLVNEVYQLLTSEKTQTFKSSKVSAKEITIVSTGKRDVTDVATVVNQKTERPKGTVPTRKTKTVTCKKCHTDFVTSFDFTGEICDTCPVN